MEPQNSKDTKVDELLAARAKLVVALPGATLEVLEKLMAGIRSGEIKGKDLAIVFGIMSDKVAAFLGGGEWRRELVMREIIPVEDRLEGLRRLLGTEKKEGEREIKEPQTSQFPPEK